MSPIPGGYILIARSITENPDVFDGCPPLRLKLWVWMLAKAFWKDGEKLQRGQLLTSIDEMREAMSYKIGYRTSTPTKAEIRNSYEAFMKASMISTAKSTRGMIITIEKYDTYQDFSSYEQHSESHNEDSTKIQTTTQDRENSIKQENISKSSNEDLLVGNTSVPDHAPSPVNCPYAKIIGLYHCILPELNQVKVLPETAKAHLRSRWREDKQRQNLEWWDQFFRTVKASPFLTGNVRDWRADLAWLVRPNNFAKVINGNYAAESGKTYEQIVADRVADFERRQK